MKIAVNVRRLIIIGIAWTICTGFSFSRLMAQDEPVRLKPERMTLKETITAIESQTPWRFSYNPSAIDPKSEIEFMKDTGTVNEILEIIEGQLQVKYSIRDGVIILRSGKKAEHCVLKGTIVDAASGEVMPGAHLTMKNGSVGVTANAYGFFSLKGDKGVPEKINVTFVGYRGAQFSFSFERDSTALIKLERESIILEDIEVGGERDRSGSEITLQGSGYIVSGEKIRETSSFAGEPDALKTLQLLPGIQSGNEGTTNISVRGGSYDQNLYLLDEAPVYNPSHALSFFSVFNPDAVQSLTLYKSGIPTRHGGRLSSVVDVRMREGNRIKRSYRGSVGLIASRLTAEGPVGESGRTSFMLSGRYSYAGQVLNGIYAVGSYVFNDPTANNSTTDNKVSFYDVNAKINFRRNDRDHFYISVYSGYDNFYFNHITSGYALSWGNRTGTFRWNHVYNSRLFSNTTAVFSDYGYEYRILDNTRYFLWSASLTELMGKQDFDFYINNNNHITFGWAASAFRIEPGKISPRSSESVSTTYSLQTQRPRNATVYIANEQQVGSNLVLSYGLRFSGLANVGPYTAYQFQPGESRPYDSTRYGHGEIAKMYGLIEPRFGLQWLRNANIVSLTYDRTAQYFHLLANSSIGLPTDIWMPSSENIKPQTADIIAMAWERKWSKAIEGSIGGFYKRLNDIVDFRDNANLFVNKYVESQLLQGEGEAYGAEFFIQRVEGNVTGSVSYTWSKVLNRIKGVNDDRPFAGRYDKRNNLAITGRWQMSDRWTSSLNFVYTSGGALTVPAGNFSFDGVTFNYFTERNGFRLPDYHRLDLSMRYSPRRNAQRTYKSYWSFDVYNLYGRRNSFVVYSQQNDNGFVKTDVKAIYLFKILPSVSYNFTF